MRNVSYAHARGVLGVGFASTAGVFAERISHKSQGLGIAPEFALTSENTSASFQQVKAAHQPAGHAELLKRSPCFTS